MLGLIAALALAGCISGGPGQAPENPQTAADYIARGKALTDKKETQGQAIVSFRRAQLLAATDDERVEALKGLGDLYFRIRRDSDAINCYGEALRLRPEDPAVRTMLGAALINLENYDAALEALNSVIEKNPSYPQAYAWRALVYHRRKLWDKAILDYQRALLMELPRTLRVKVCGSLADACFKMGQYQEALESWREMIRLEPRMDTPEVRRYMKLARAAQKERTGP